MAGLDSVSSGANNHAMYETDTELLGLQSLIDRTYERAGSHLQTIHTAERRLGAQDVSDVLRGVCILNLATVSKGGAPVVAPVDGLFLHGKFWFGSAPNSLRFRHIRGNPLVSAAYTLGEEVSVIVHGTAREIDTSTGDYQDLYDYCTEIYGETFKSWDFWGKNPYAYIEAERFYAIRIEAHGD